MKLVLQSVGYFCRMKKTLIRSNDVPLDQVLTSSAFNRWLQIEYLPSDFKCNEKNGQDRTRMRQWYKFIKFDIYEFFHLFSISILIIWISSVLIFAIYLIGPCSPLVSSSTQQFTIADKAFNNFLNLNYTSVRFNSTIGSRLHRARQVLMENEVQSNRSNYDEIEENLRSCIIMTAYAITNISLATLLLSHLFFYIIHVVERLQIFPWFAIEIAFSVIFLLLIFIFNVVLCIVSDVYTTEMIVSLGILQSVFGLIFCELHFRREAVKATNLQTNLPFL